MESNIIIYTDGSCHTQFKIGAWSAIVLYNNQKIILSGLEQNTTNQRMELIAVLNAIKYIKINFTNIKSIQLNTDSQYVIGLVERAEKLNHKSFKTNKGNEIRNIDLVKEWLNINNHFEIELIKIKSHQRLTESTKYNIEADKTARKLVRESVSKLEIKN